MHKIAHQPTLPELAIQKAIDRLVGMTGSDFMQSLASVSDEKLKEMTQSYIPTLGLKVSDRHALQRLQLLLEVAEQSMARLQNNSALRAAKARSTQVKDQLVRSGQLVSAAELADALGITRQAVHKAQKAGRFFALEAGGRDLYYPAFFADADLRENGLDKILRVLSLESSWSKWLFLTSSSGALGGSTPLDALRSSKLEPVLEVARASLDR